MEFFLIPLSIIIPILLVLIILITTFKILYSQNKKIYSKILSEKERFNFYEKSLQDLKNSKNKNPKTNFEILNKLARDFFKEYFNLSYSLTYLELKEFFEKENRQNFAVFCKSLSDLNYSKEKIEVDDIDRLLDAFLKIIINFYNFT